MRLHPLSNYRWHVVAEMPFEAASFNLSHERACDEDSQREVLGTSNEDVTFELAAQRLARAEAFATTKPRGSSSLEPNLILSRSRVSGATFEVSQPYAANLVFNQ